MTQTKSEPALADWTVEQRLDRIEAAIAELGWRSAQMNGRIGFSKGHPAAFALMAEYATRNYEGGEHPQFPTWFAAIKGTEGNARYSRW